MIEGSRHHVLFPRVLWDATKPTRMLRGHQWLIPRLDHGVHHELHDALAIVPIPDFHVALHALADFHPPHNHVRAIRELMTCIDDAIAHPRAGIIERGVGQLAIAALEVQLPFIKDGLILPSQYQ